MIEIALYFFYVLQILLAIHLLIPFVVFILDIFISDRTLLTDTRETVQEIDFAAIVTAHQETKFIPPLVDSFLQQSYKNFTLYIVADDCDISRFKPTDDKIRIISPENALHAKIKSIEFALSNLVRQHDVLVVFDSDNLIHPDYLHNLNRYFASGYKAVQTHMLSKNIDSKFAKLDSIGHIYNNFVERSGRMNLGLSSGILGLGIAIDLDVYQKVMYKDGLGGFDKKLQAHLVEFVNPIAFAKDAFVYDEKIEDSKAFERQRTRWMHTYFKYFMIYFILFFKGIKKGSFDISFFAFNALRPPLLVSISLSLLSMTYWFAIGSNLGLLWLMVLFIFTLTYILIVIIHSYQKGMTKALIYIPLAMFSQFKSLFRIRKASKSFLKTEHSKVIYIKDLLNDGKD